jgi:hypothetical protein
MNNPPTAIGGILTFVQVRCQHLVSSYLRGPPEKRGQRGELTNYRKDYQSNERSIVEEPHNGATKKPRDTKRCIKQTESRAAPWCWNRTGQHRFQQRVLCTDADTPKNHAR